MDDDHRIVGEGAVEFGLRGKALLGEEIGIAPEAHHDLPWAKLATVFCLPEGRDHIGHALAGAGRRRGAEGLRLHVDEREEVAMAIDEAGHERPAGKVDDLRLLTPRGEDVRLLSHGDDPAASNGHGFGTGRCIGDGEDRAADVDPLGRFGSDGPCSRDHEPTDHGKPASSPDLRNHGTPSGSRREG